MATVVRGPNWECVTPAAAWEPRDSCAELVYRDCFWIMGGWFTPKTPNPRDVWKSPDGRHWEKVLQEAPWEKSDLPGSVVFRDRMWHMGGRSLPGTECSNEVWSTQDGIAWECATRQAGWCPRLGPGTAVFKDRMWIFGGTSDFYHANDQTLFNDIWSSADGRTWRLESAAAPWAPRACHQVVEMQGRLWLTAGGAWIKGSPVYGDVWCSEDGVHWECVLEQAPWAARVWHGSVAYRGCLWVVAGDARVNDAPCLLNDVWFSQDGVDWRRLESEVVFSRRHEVSMVVFQDRMWLAGGHAMPLTHDVWALTLPHDFPAGLASQEA